MYVSRGSWEVKIRLRFHLVNKILIPPYVIRVTGSYVRDRKLQIDYVIIKSLVRKIYLCLNLSHDKQ